MSIFSGVSCLSDYYDCQYDYREGVEGFNSYPRRYRFLSDQAHLSLQCHPDQPYGPGPGEKLDIFPATQADAPIFIFFHGGLWSSLTKADSAFMANALTELGICVVIPDYDLAPAVTLDQQLDQAQRVSAWVYHNINDFGGDPKRIYMSGSSSGAQLVGMLLSDGWHAKYSLPVDLVRGAILISGIFNLEPIRHTRMNKWLGLCRSSVLRNSPIHNIPSFGGEILVAFGANESEEFKRQSTKYLAAWRKQGLVGCGIEVPGKSHFDVVLDLGRPGTDFFKAVMTMLLGS